MLYATFSIIGFMLKERKKGRKKWKKKKDRNKERKIRKKKRKERGKRKKKKERRKEKREKRTSLKVYNTGYLHEQISGRKKPQHTLEYP